MSVETKGSLYIGLAVVVWWKVCYVCSITGMGKKKGGQKEV
jgi:hypothetical protein